MYPSKNPPGGPPMPLTVFRKGGEVVTFPPPQTTAEFLAMFGIAVRRFVGSDAVVEVGDGVFSEVATFTQGNLDAVMVKERARRAKRK